MEKRTAANGKSETNVCYSGKYDGIHAQTHNEIVNVVSFWLCVCIGIRLLGLTFHHVPNVSNAFKCR